MNGLDQVDGGKELNNRLCDLKQSLSTERSGSNTGGTKLKKVNKMKRKQYYGIIRDGELEEVYTDRETADEYVSEYPKGWTDGSYLVKSDAEVIRGIKNILNRVNTNKVGKDRYTRQDIINKAKIFKKKEVK